MSILMAVLGGLGIFMLGMKHMSEGMQAVAGNSLRRMISLVSLLGLIHFRLISRPFVLATGLLLVSATPTRARSPGPS